MSKVKSRDNNQTNISEIIMFDCDISPVYFSISSDRQLGTEGSELPRGSGHISTEITWPRPINDV